MPYASACAWAAVHPDRIAEGWSKYGLAGAAIRVEHEAWKRHFEQHPEEREEFEHQLASFKRHWAARG